MRLYCCSDLLCESGTSSSPLNLRFRETQAGGDPECVVTTLQGVPFGKRIRSSRGFRDQEGFKTQMDALMVGFQTMEEGAY